MMKVDLTVKTTCDFPKCNFDHLSKRPDIAQAVTGNARFLRGDN